MRPSISSCILNSVQGGHLALLDSTCTMQNPFLTKVKIFGITKTRDAVILVLKTLLFPMGRRKQSVWSWFISPWLPYSKNPRSGALGGGRYKHSVLFNDLCTEQGKLTSYYSFLFNKWHYQRCAPKVIFLLLHFLYPQQNRVYCTALTGLRDLLCFFLNTIKKANDYLHQRGLNYL
jgi:hypothetical protein